MQPLKEHDFSNGAMLLLDASNTLSGLHSLTVYTVFYGSKDGDELQSVGAEPYMSQTEAEQAFEKRLTATDPSEPTREQGGIYNLVLDAFQRYLGENPLRSEQLPTEWASFFDHVKEKTIGRDKFYYDGEKVHAALDGLTTTSTRDSGGRADVMIELPVWKLLEMLTAITALAMALRLQIEPRLRTAA